MCGCTCCTTSDPTCFDPQAPDGAGMWRCRCACPNCVSRVIRAALALGATRESARREATWQDVLTSAERRARMAERSELWALLHPVVTEIAFRNTGGE